MEAFLDTRSHGPSALQRTAGDVTARVVAHEWANSEYKHLVLDAPKPAPQAQAGQFFHMECPPVDEHRPFLRRPMSVYKADPSKGQIEFLYKVTGAGTRGLATLRPGDKLQTLGPLGVGFKLDESWKNIVVLGRGVGLATLAPLAEMAAANRVGVTAIFSARGPAQVMSVERFARTGARIEIALDSDGSSAPETIERLLRQIADRGEADAFFICGSNRLMLLMQRLGRELGIPGEVALEQQMACGIGMCFCCVRNFRSGNAIVSRRVCWDGPVFRLDEAMSW